MKNLITALFVLTSLTFGASVAYSAPNDPSLKTPANVYVFDDIVIDGLIARPSFLAFNSRKKAKFDRLSHLAKSFKPSLFASGRESLFN